MPNLQSSTRAVTSWTPTGVRTNVDGTKVVILTVTYTTGTPATETVEFVAQKVS